MYFAVILLCLILQILAQYPPGVPPRSNQQYQYGMDDSQNEHHFQQQQDQQRGPLFDERYISAEKDHIGSHLNAEYDKTMSDEQFFFLQFKSMDSDNSNHIDGSEIYKAIYHALKENTTKNHRLLSHEIELKTDEFLKYCSNPQWNSGFITYEDFKRCAPKGNHQRA